MGKVITVSVDVSKEVYELGQGIVKFVSVVKKSLDDGWQVGSDFPAVMASAIKDLIPAMDGVSLMADELMSTPAAFSAAIELSLKDLVGVFLTK